MKRILSVFGNLFGKKNRQPPKTKSAPTISEEHSGIRLSQLGAAFYRQGMPGNIQTEIRNLLTNIELGEIEHPPLKKDAQGRNHFLIPLSEFGLLPKALEGKALKIFVKEGILYYSNRLTDIQ